LIDEYNSDASSSKETDGTEPHAQADGQREIRTVSVSSLLLHVGSHDEDG